MKRIGNVYSKICSMENLYEAHKKARKDKGYYKEVKMVDENPGLYLSVIQYMLKNHTYEISLDDYTVQTINDKGKERELWKLPYFPHRIIQWAILLQIEDVFHKVFTEFTCASLKGRGIHYALKRTRGIVNNHQDESKYCLKMDVHHFYQNIDHETLKQMLRKKFKDKELLWLLDMIIDSRKPVGVPIGSYLSQYLANFYLSYFDHWLKEKLGCKHVVRYMDDIVIFDSSKERLHEWFDQIERYLNDNLKLDVKDNWQVFPTNVRGVDFVGYRTFVGYTLLRKRIYKRFKRKMATIKKHGRHIAYSDYCAFNSYMGWLRWCNSRRLRDKYWVPLLPDVNNYYFTHIKRRGTK